MYHPLGSPSPGMALTEARDSIKNPSQKSPVGTPVGVRDLGPGGLNRTLTRGVPIHKVAAKANGEEDILGTPARVAVRRRNIGVNIRKSSVPS